jgi:linoleate 8R-lipoxygenase / 9,12-octadecadienoate 8-hydroperoxide 8R-isomerase
MSERTLRQALRQLFGLDDETISSIALVQRSNQSSSELLGFINVVKLELHKLGKGGQSFIADLKALMTDAVKDAITLCEYGTNIILGNPIDDSLLEMEKIITLLCTLPSDSHFGTSMSRIFIGSLWKLVAHPPASFQNQIGYQWRSVDGSGNNLAFPEIGKAGQKFIQECIPKRPRALNLPDPGAIFDDLLRRRADSNGVFKGSESSISSNLFYLATIITHDLFNTDPVDNTVNLTTSYLDLCPLFGWTKEMQNIVRTGWSGLLKSDHFADTRFWIQPAGVIALLVLFNRNHNYLAAKLLDIDEHTRFSSLHDEERDEALFQTARLINQRTYVNVILHDYLRVILGVNRVRSPWTLNVLQDFSAAGADADIPMATGNQCSVEFNFLYRWHHATSLEDEVWLGGEFSRLFGDWKNMDMKTMFRKLGEVTSDQKQHSRLVRSEDGCFEDRDLARALIDGCRNISGAFGGRNTPAVFRNIEISGILHARRIGVCTLNEYRSHRKLKKYQSFHELNADLVDQLAKLYPTVDDVEFYPGLLCERRKPAVDGSGLCPNYTTAFAILSDAVALVRGDRFHSKDATHFNLTNFGMEDSQPDDTIDYGTLIGHKLILRHLKDLYSPNSVHVIFPFTLPSETWKNLGDHRTNYDFTVPM